MLSKVSRKKQNVVFLKKQGNPIGFSGGLLLGKCACHRNPNYDEVLTNLDVLDAGHVFVVRQSH